MSSATLHAYRGDANPEDVLRDDLPAARTPGWADFEGPLLRADEIFLGCASAKSHGLIDRRLYLPKEWATDVERSDAACISDEFSDPCPRSYGTQPPNRPRDRPTRRRWARPISPARSSNIAAAL
jgi:hypothetical protein